MIKQRKIELLAPAKNMECCLLYTSDRDFWDFSTRAGKQLVWIICSFGLGFVLLMLEDSVYDMFAYLIYIAPVSYTHLDVYKRQSTYRTGNRRHALC